MLLLHAHLHTLIRACVHVTHGTTEVARVALVSNLYRECAHYETRCIPLDAVADNENASEYINA